MTGILHWSAEQSNEYPYRTWNTGNFPEQGKNSSDITFYYYYFITDLPPMYDIDGKVGCFLYREYTMRYKVDGQEIKFTNEKTPTLKCPRYLVCT